VDFAERHELVKNKAPKHLQDPEIHAEIEKAAATLMYKWSDAKGASEMCGRFFEGEKVDTPKAFVPIVIETFVELDKDKDGLLNAEEVRRRSELVPHCHIFRHVR
jgi:hypothetical protein